MSNFTIHIDENTKIEPKDGTVFRNSYHRASDPGGGFGSLNVKVMLYDGLTCKIESYSFHKNLGLVLHYSPRGLDRLPVRLSIEKEKNEFEDILPIITHWAKIMHLDYEEMVSTGDYGDTFEEKSKDEIHWIIEQCTSTHQNAFNDLDQVAQIKKEQRLLDAKLNTLQKEHNKDGRALRKSLLSIAPKTSLT